MNDDDRPQRARQWVDRDLIEISMKYFHMPAGKAATEIVGRTDYEVGDRGVVLVRYGDISSPVGEAFLRIFVRNIVQTHPAVFNEELYALAKVGQNDTRDERRLVAEPSAERTAEINQLVRGAL